MCWAAVAAVAGAYAASAAAQPTTRKRLTNCCNCGAPAEPICSYCKTPGLGGSGALNAFYGYTSLDTRRAHEARYG